jgi:hypothetical protein
MFHRRGPSVVILVVVPGPSGSITNSEVSIPSGTSKSGGTNSATRPIVEGRPKSSRARQSWLGQCSGMTPERRGLLVVLRRGRAARTDNSASRWSWPCVELDERLAFDDLPNVTAPRVRASDVEVRRTLRQLPPLSEGDHHRRHLRGLVAPNARLARSTVRRPQRHRAEGNHAVSLAGLRWEDREGWI